MVVRKADMMRLVAALYVLSASHAFVQQRPFSSSALNGRAVSSSTAVRSNNDNNNGVVVISPPGGVGEVAAVEAAKRGASVRWFVVSSTDDDDRTFFSAESMAAVKEAGGKVELAGCKIPALLVPEDDAESAVPAVSAWCGRSDAVVVCADRVDEGEGEGNKKNDNEEDDSSSLRDAVKVAAREAAKSCVAGGVKVVVTSLEELEEKLESENEENGGGGNNDNDGLDVSQLLPSFLGGGKKVSVPSTLEKAMGSGSVVSLRHGELFGVPESSRDTSPFVGGPRREPKLREEYTTRAARLDPSTSVLSNPTLRSRTRSSRLSVGAAAAVLATKSFQRKASSPLDVCLASIRGVEALTDREWATEFGRVEESTGVSSSSSSSSPNLFSAAFGAVPDVGRLSEWLASKWAPAILRSYDIAGIRVGARPVYASKVAEDRVEIVWLEMVDFESRTVGRIVIGVSEKGLEARRESVATSTSFKPLKGEEIIIRSLVDAAAQAVEKGLAVKAAPVKKPKPVAVAAAPVQPATTVVSSATVEVDPTPAAAAAPAAPAAPRSRKRSSDRSRGAGRERKRSSSGRSRAAKESPVVAEGDVATPPPAPPVAPEVASTSSDPVASAEVKESPPAAASSSSSSPEPPAAKTAESSTPPPAKESSSSGPAKSSRVRRKKSKTGDRMKETMGAEDDAPSSAAKKKPSSDDENNSFE